jgi:hypothetical protein
MGSHYTTNSSHRRPTPNAEQGNSRAGRLIRPVAK